MLRCNEECAFDVAVEIAKAICTNPNNKTLLDSDSANDIANFIRTLEAKFLGEDLSDDE